MFPCWTMTKDKAGPKGRHAAMTLHGDKVYAFGGDSAYNMDQMDVHIFNTGALSWTKLPPAVTTGGEDCPPEVPTRRRGHTAALREDIVYIWGGITYKRGRCSALYAFDVTTHAWSKPHVSGTIPAGRWGHSACVLAKVVYVYGGHTHLTGYTNDIYKLDITTMVWSLVDTIGTPAAPVSACHSATTIGTKMFVFGGYNYDHVHNNISVFNTETNSWLSTPSAQLVPEGRKGHSAFAYSGELYIFGGDDFNSMSNDLWKFNPDTFSWKQIETKGNGPRQMTATCCLVGDRIILFGGDILDDLCVLNLSPSLNMLCKQAEMAQEVERSSGKEKVHD